MPRSGCTGPVAHKAMRAVYPAVELTDAVERSERWMQILDFGQDNIGGSRLC
jgi:hypothetical protein